MAEASAGPADAPRHDPTAPSCVVCGLQDPWWVMRLVREGDSRPEAVCVSCDRYLTRCREARAYLRAHGVEAL